MTVRSGVVGLGFMGRQYVEIMHRLEGVQVTAVCDLRGELVEELSQKTGAEPFHEAAELAASPAVDAVFVCTPEDRHVEAALAAIRARKPVMIEKPVAHTLESAWQIVEAASAADSMVMVGHLLRFEPRWAAAKRALDAGDIGSVVSIAARRVGNVLDQEILG